MPFTRKTSRKPTRCFITQSQLAEANWQVTTEMEALGLWSESLEDVDVCLVPFSHSCYGWFLPEGNIHIPAFSGAHLYDFVSGQHTRLTDVLRHEWAHALADRQPQWVENNRFTRAFGGDYEHECRLHSYDPEHHLTAYAATSPCEDFAETFHFYLRHKGRLPTRLSTRPNISRKWKFIDWMASRISK